MGSEPTSLLVSLGPRANYSRHYGLLFSALPVNRFSVITLASDPTLRRFLRERNLASCGAGFAEGRLACNVNQPFGR